MTTRELNILHVIHALNAAGVCWWLMYGTLLSFIRDNRFPEGTEDIDIAILAEDRGKLEQVPNLETTMHVDGKPTAWACGDLWGINNPRINITAFVKKNHLRFFPYQDGPNIVLQTPLVDPITLTAYPWNDTLVFVPNNATQLFKRWYTNWRIPMPEKTRMIEFHVTSLDDPLPATISNFQHPWHD